MFLLSMQTYSSTKISNINMENTTLSPTIGVYSYGEYKHKKIILYSIWFKQIFRIKFTCSMFIYLQKQWMRTFRKNGNVNRLLKDCSDDTSFSGWIPLSRVVVSNLPFARATFVFFKPAKV